MKQSIDFRPYIGSLADRAFNSGASRGRRHCKMHDEDSRYYPCLDPFFLDVKKIALSKFLRRLSGKTQVFIGRDNPHIRDRRVHTDEVVALGTMMSDILGLNTKLVEAITLGHDLGHAPYGHLGERAIAEVSGQPFRHETMSVVILQKIDRSGKGLNLSWETLEGILNHSRGGRSLEINPDFPLEYGTSMMADKISYTFSDLNDALRCGYFAEKDLPREFFDLGRNQRDRWLNCIFALVKESSEKGIISFFESETGQKFEALRQWSYLNFYKYVDGRIRHEALDNLQAVYKFLADWRDVLDYPPCLSLSLMTDDEVNRVAKFAAFPTIRNKEMLEAFSFAEILRGLPDSHNLDIFDADLKAEDFSRG